MWNKCNSEKSNQKMAVAGNLHKKNPKKSTQKKNQNSGTKRDSYTELNWRLH